MTEWQTLFNTALVAKLATNASLVALVSTRIYDQQAPQGASLPFVIFDHVAGGEDNNSPRADKVFRYQIEAVAGTLAQARTIRGYIEDTLHNVELIITGWSNYKSMCADLITPPVENVEGVQYWRRGNDYEFGLSQNS